MRFIIMNFGPLFIIILINMMRRHNFNENPVEISKQQKPTVNFEFDWIVDIGKKFIEQVQKPLQIRQSLINSSEPQRCLAHNIAYSIYCTICRKALCASCMYTTPQHRKHRVIPIENATDQMKEDIKTFQSKIMKVGNQAEGLIDSNSQILIKIEKQYNPLIGKLKEFYQSLKDYLKKKEKQQLQHLREIKEAATAQVSQYNRELSRISQVLMSKLLQCTKQGYKFAQILTPRILLETVMQASSLINQNLLDGQKFKFPTDIEKILTMESEIRWKIDKLINKFQTPLRNSHPIDKAKISAKKVSFTERRMKLQQIPNRQDRMGKRKNKSMSNIAGRSQLFKR